MAGKSSGSTRPAYYVCARRKYYGPSDGCPGPSLHARWSEETVWKYLDAILSSPETVCRIVAEANRRLSEHAPEFKGRLEEVRQEIAAITVKQRRWMERYESAKDDVSVQASWDRIRELKARELDLRKEADSLEGKLATPRHKELAPEEIGRYLARLREGGASSPEKRRGFVERLRLHHDLRVRALDDRRLVVSLQVDQERMALGAQKGGARLFMIPNAAGSARPRPMSPGSPEPGYTGHTEGEGPAFVATIEEILEIQLPRAETAPCWAERVQPEAPLCACGYGERVRVKLIGVWRGRARG
jgi:hypothetical protein